jgi:excisionase family DNA binding protein
MGYYETLYGSYPTFLIRIDEEVQGSNNGHYSDSNYLEKDTDAAFDTKEAARRLGCSPGQVRELVHEEKIGHKKIGKNFRFTSEHINEFLRSEQGNNQKTQRVNKQDSERRRKQEQKQEGSSMPTREEIKKLWES